MTAAEVCLDLAEKSRAQGVPGTEGQSWPSETVSPFIIFPVEIIHLEPQLTWVSRTGNPWICSGPAAQLSSLVLSSSWLRLFFLHPRLVHSDLLPHLRTTRVHWLMSQGLGGVQGFDSTVLGPKGHSSSVCLKWSYKIMYVAANWNVLFLYTPPCCLLWILGWV